MIEIKLSVYFKNHLNKLIKLDDKIVDFEESILEISNKKIYNSLTIVVSDIYFDVSVINNYERIKIKFIDSLNKELKEFFYIINDVEYLNNNVLKVYCKSRSYKYTTIKINKVIKANSIKELIVILFRDTKIELLDDFTINMSNLTDIPLLFDYTIEDKTIDEVINDLSKITDFDYYFYNGILYFEDKKVIKKDDASITTFKDISDIEEFSTTTNKENIINKLFINTNENEIIATPKITLDIKDSPQCCSPDNVEIFTDENNNTYKINPINALYTIYYTPLFSTPTTNLNTSFKEKIVLEKYELQNDNYVSLAGGILDVIAVEGVVNWNYEKNYNILTFDFVENGELKITYKTNVLFGYIQHSKYPKKINMLITHYNQIIDYNHNIELNGYYPIPYSFSLSLVSDWGIDIENALQKNVTISIYKDGLYYEVVNVISDEFGDISFDINEYGTYRLKIDNYDNLYLDYYINKKSISMDEVE